MGKRIGIIGGTGLYQMSGVENIEEVKMSTPFGEPSDSFFLCNFEKRELVFLSRHGRGHRIMPSEINFRANIYGMKKLGVEWIISVSAVGSMREDIKPGEMVIPHQFFDRTKGRKGTFFGKGIVGHISFADPVCKSLADILYRAGSSAGAKVHLGGTYICIEGPQFSTRAESKVYRQWGVDVIGMTNLQEAKLSREAEICYATLAMVTDYDCWHDREEDVSVEAIIQILNKNVSIAQEIIKNAVRNISDERRCECPDALKFAIITDKSMIPEMVKDDLKVIIGKYIN